MTSCPCCGAPMSADAVSVTALEALPLSPAPRAVLNMLVAAYPQPVTMDALVGRVYPNPNVGPEDHVGAIMSRVWRLRGVVSKIGWTITSSNHSRGYALRRLERPA